MTLPLGLSGSDLVDRRVLQAERDVVRADRRALLADMARDALALELDQARHQKAIETARTHALQHQLDQLYASTSWRVSRPVRAFSKLMQILQRRAPAIPSSVPPPAPGPANVAEAASLPLGTREQAILRRLQGRAPI